MSWIQTRSGTFDFINPRSEDVRIEDIAHALAYLCRYTGHCAQFYSVAQHSVLVSRQCHPSYRLIGLLHDAQEAYIGDVSAPLKSLLPDYQEIEIRVWQAVAAHFRLPASIPMGVAEVDVRMCLTEKQVLFSEEMDWNAPYDPYPDVHIIPWAPEVARKSFLKEFSYLTIKERSS